MQKEQGQNNLRVEVGLFGLEQGVRTLRNLVPGHRDTMAGFELHSSGFSTHAARPLGESREHLSRELQKRHFRSNPNIKIEIVHPDKADVLEVAVRGEQQKQISPAVLREFENGEIVIYLSEAIFTSTLHSDPRKNADQQIKFAGRLIGMLLPRRQLEVSGETLLSRAADWLSKDILFSGRQAGNHNDYLERRLTAQSAVIYGCSVRHIVDMLRTTKLDRYLSWEHIASKITRAYPEGSPNDLSNTQKLYTEITANKAGEYWIFTRGSFVQVEEPAIGSKLEALSSALAAIGSLGRMRDIDTVGQALVLHYARSTPTEKKSETSLFKKASLEAKSLAGAFERLSKLSFEVPNTFETDRADLSLANLHQRFIQSVKTIAEQTAVNPEHLCAMYLTTTYVRACHCNGLTPEAREQAMYQVYLFDAALAQRLASSHLAEKMRYAVFSQCQAEELNSVREMLGGYLGLDMETARNFERGVRKHFEVHSDELESKLGFSVKTEVRLKGYLSLYEKLEEMKAELYEIFRDGNEAIASAIIQDLEFAVKRFKTGTIGEREAVCESISKNWINFFTDFPDAQNVIRDFLDVTDCFGVRLTCNTQEDLERLTDSLDEVFREYLQGRLSFDDGMTITGVREIGDEAVNSADPRRDKISKGAVPWKLRRYAFEITDQQGDEVKTWEMPIEVQLITEEEHKRQRVGEEPRKYGFPHWWLKAARQVSNYSQKNGMLPDNRYCGAQISFQDAEHDGTSLTEAFNAATHSVTGIHLSVFDNERWLPKEIVLPFGSTQQELLETIGLQPEQYALHDTAQNSAVPRDAILTPADLYSVVRSPAPLPYLTPRTPRGIIEKNRFGSPQEELENLLRGGKVLDSLLGNPFFEGAPRYDELSACVNDFVSPHFALRNTRELSSYLGALSMSIESKSGENGLLPSAEASKLLQQTAARIVELVGYHFQFPEATSTRHAGSGVLVVHLQRNTSSFMLEVARQIPLAIGGPFYSVQSGNVSKREDGGVEMRLQLDMPPAVLEQFSRRINGLAFSKARESLLGGGQEAKIELWLRDKPNTFLTVLDVAQKNGLAPVGFRMDGSSMRNQFIPFNQGKTSGMYRPTEWIFELMNRSDNSNAAMRQALDGLMNELVEMHLVLRNTPPFVKQASPFGGLLLTPYLRPDKKL